MKIAPTAWRIFDPQCKKTFATISAIAKMSAAFEAALRKLGLVDRTDPKAVAVAKLIIEFAKVGERDPERLCLALQQLTR